MTDQDNPYHPPDSTAEAVSEPALLDDMVNRGRFAFLGIAAFLLIPELLLWVMGAEPAPVRIALTVGLLFAVWRGHGWAIILLAIVLCLGILASLLCLCMSIDAGSRLAVAVVLSYAGVDALILVGLIRSESLNQFFQYQAQRRQRDEPVREITDNRRDVLTLTPDAAELTRKIIIYRGFAPGTALRVVLGTGGNAPPGIKFDVPVAGDENDWVGQSSGVVVLVDKAIADELEGLTIDAKDGQYTFNMPYRTSTKD